MRHFLHRTWPGVGLLLALWGAGCRQSGTPATPPAGADARVSRAVPANEKITAPDEVSAGTSATRKPPADVAAALPPARRPGQYRAGTVGDVNLLRLFADRFGDLPRRDRALVYHLARAVLAGRDIVYDQLHRHGLRVRRLFEQIQLNNSDLSPELDGAVEQSLQLLWLNNGLYDLISGVKIRLPIDYQQLQAAALAASALGAEIGNGDEESLEETLSLLRGTIFDPRTEGVLAGARPALGQDLVGDSHLNLYSGVKMSELKKVQEHYQRNSRLVRVDGRLIEQVYRAGDRIRKIPRGRYFRQLRRVVRRLQEAMVVARRRERMAITALVEAFRSGDDSAYARACRILGEHREEVLFSLGFSDREIDPRRVKGLFAGFVAIGNPADSARVTALERDAGKLVAALPWRPEWRREGVADPTARSADLLVSVGRRGPAVARSALLCPPEMAGGGKVVVFGNVVRSWAQGYLRPLAEQLLEGTDWSECLVDTAFLHAVLRDVIAPRVGRENRRLRRRLASLATPLQRLRNEAAALWWLGRDLAREHGLPAPGHGEVATRLLLAWLVGEQALVRDEVLRQPSWLARRLLARYLVEEAGVVLEQQGERWLLRVKDARRYQQRLEALLRRLQGILYRADRRAAATLVSRYSSPARWKALDNLEKLLRQAGLKRLTAFVMPKLRPQFSPTRKVVDARVLNDETFERQMMRYRRY